LPTASSQPVSSGKETVYSGLQQAQSTLEVKSSVLGLSSDKSKLDQVQFNVALSIPTQSVDSSAVVVNYWDANTHTEGATFTLVKAAGSTERGSAAMIEGDEEFTCTVDIPSNTTLVGYDTFNIQVVPPTGASITITRTLPNSIDKVMNLN
jgi:flagellin FlaB